MPLTLEQYLEYLDNRSDLPWPVAPEVEKPKAKPSLTRVPVRAVTWSVYGTLLSLAGGELWFEHPHPFVMETALDKTIQEFKMWQSMTRKPGKPSAYMKEIYTGVLADQRLTSSVAGERHPELLSDKVWLAILKKLMQKEYSFNASFYGSMDDYCRKIAYFFHASLQGVAPYPGAVAALSHVQQSLGFQGILADGQCFSAAQLQRALRQDGLTMPLNLLFPDVFQVWSYAIRGKKPSERLYKEMAGRMKAKGVEPGDVLHVGSSVPNDVIPAKKVGFKTALFAGDKASLVASAEHFKQPASRPDVMLTELSQIMDIVG